MHFSSLLRHPLASILPLVTLAFPFGANSAAIAVSHQKRAFDNARITWFNIGLTACGQVFEDNDLVVAVSNAEYNSGLSCGRNIAITVNGKTVNAEIGDLCRTCSSGDLDATRGLFSQWADPETTGIVTGSWDFV